MNERTLYEREREKGEKNGFSSFVKNENRRECNAISECNFKKNSNVMNFCNTICVTQCAQISMRLWLSLREHHHRQIRYQRDKIDERNYKWNYGLRWS